MLFSSPSIADEFESEIKRNDLFLQMVSANLVALHYSQDDPCPNIEDNSESKWSPIIRRTWPYYINGVSRMWVELIDELARNKSETPNSLDKHLDDFYRAIEGEMTQLYKTQGKWPFLHHLCALFSYSPIDIPIIFQNPIEPGQQCVLSLRF